MNQKNENQELVSELTDADLEAISGGYTSDQLNAAWNHSEDNLSYGVKGSYNLTTGEARIEGQVKWSF